MNAELRQEARMHPMPENQKFLNVRVEKQVFGIPIPIIQDVLQDLKITPVPLTPPHVSGLLNLRGRIVAAIDIRTSLGLPRMACGTGSKVMSVIVEHNGELFSLLVDAVGDITDIPPDQIEKNPDNLSERWKAVSLGIYKLKDKLIIITNIQKLIGL
jgi:purine-binding chemotaxis protein CheW